MFSSPRMAVLHVLNNTQLGYETSSSIGLLRGEAQKHCSAVVPHETACKTASRWRKDHGLRYLDCVMSTTMFCYYKKCESDESQMQRFVQRMGNSLDRQLARQGIVRRGSMLDILGIQPEEFISHFVKYIGNPCEVCNKPYDGTFQIDHIEPRARAATEQDVLRLNQLDNLRVICRACNLKKGDSAG